MPTLKSHSDADLITAIVTQADVNGAVTHLYKMYYRPLKRYVLINSGNEMDAEDLIQDVMVAFVDLVQQGKYRGEASVKSFLYKLAHNLWITELRKRNSNAKRNELFEMERGQLTEDVSDYILYQEAQQTIAELFNRMGATCRKILTLFYYHELPMKDILKQTNYENEQVLRNRKYKCLKEIAETIQRTPGIYENVKAALRRTQ